MDTVTSLRKKLESLESEGKGDLPIVLYTEISEDADVCRDAVVVDSEESAPYVKADYPDVAFPHVVLR